jgi:predicted nucleotidyltransferase
MDRKLAKNIIATITYYDVLDHPLTFFEIWKHMVDAWPQEHGSVFDLERVRVSLEKERVIKKYVGQKNGFYFLHGREAIVDLRKDREIISLKKIKRLRRIVSILRVSPFVRMICVTGRLAYRNCDQDSDLDILVVYKEGHIWTGRFMLTILTHLLGVRRYNNKICDRVCLNYHITTNSLKVPTRDLFAAHEYSFIFPFYDDGEYFTVFAKKNSWIRSYKPHYSDKYKEHVRTMKDTWMTKGLRTMCEVLLADRGMENRLRKIQRKKIRENAKTYLEGALILCNDHHLVFLPKPHGPDVFEEYKKRLEALECDL